MKKILILSIADLEKYPRVLRQIDLLKNKYEIHTVGLKPSGYEDFFYEIKKDPLIIKLFRFLLLKFRLFELFYWDHYKKQVYLNLSKNKYDLIIAHSIKTLPLAVKLGTNSKIIFDEHEYAVREYDERFIWRFLFKDYLYYLIKKYVPKANTVITVCEGISEQYRKEFNFNSDVINNAAKFIDLEPTKPNNTINLIHHGSASPGRKIELMIEMMKYLGPNYELYLMLVKGKGFEKYYKKLLKLANGISNVKIIEPLPFIEIERYCNKYDIGVFLLPPTNFSLEHTLPNKFFQYIQSRLAIAIGPSPEMAKITKKYNLGVISEDYSPQSLAKSIKKLSNEQIYQYKCNSNKFAFELSFENESTKLLKIISALIDVS